MTSRRCVIETSIELPRSLWERADVLAACRSRDANALLRLARRYGASNERLAQCTGIDPGEISKRLSGKHGGPVQTLDRWERIAAGLGMPDPARLALGLAPADAPAPVGREPAVDARLAAVIDLLEQCVVLARLAAAEPATSVRRRIRPRAPIRSAARANRPGARCRTGTY